MLTLALFGLASGLVFGLLNEGFRRWGVINSKHDTQQRMARALSWMQRELEEADSDQIATKRVAAPGNGDVIWFLSAEDPTQTNPDLKFVRDPASGLPSWQRQIIYYLIRPGNYPKVSGGYNAAIDPDPRSDSFAPHKLLIRKVVNRPANPETLLTAAQVDTYVTAPADQNVAPLAAEPNVESCKLIADRLLSLEATRYDKTIELDLRAVHLQRAEREVGVGSVSLKSSRYTDHQRLRVLMKR